MRRVLSRAALRASVASKAWVPRRGHAARTVGSPPQSFAAVSTDDLWRRFAAHRTSGGPVEPPLWFEGLCRDLHFRTGGEDTMDDMARESGDAPHVVQPGATPVNDGPSDGALIPPSLLQRHDRAVELHEDDPSRLHGEGEETVDPYLWLDFAVRPEAEYTVGPYTFPEECQGYSAEQRAALCLGDESKEYVCFCDAYRFPQREQLPTSVGTEPCRLWVDPAATTPVVYVQLAPHFPPAMWLPVKPTAAAVRRVLAEFATMAAIHRDRHHSYYDGLWRDAEKQLLQQSMPRTPPHVLRYLGWMGTVTEFDTLSIKEFHNHQEVFLGEHADPEAVLKHFDSSPFLFAITKFRGRVDLFKPEMTPTVTGPGVSTALYRCIYSKALLLVKVHLAAEVKLPPQDPEAFELLWKNVSSSQHPQPKVAVFARLVWPDNKRMCGAGAVVQRFNRLMGTEFAHDVPIDAVMAAHSAAHEAGCGPELLGVHGLRERIGQLEEAALRPAAHLLYPGTGDMPNPEYTAQERLAMHIQYAAHMNDPAALGLVEKWKRFPDASVRMGCAKAALELGERAAFKDIVASEPPGRMQRFMTALVRKRKTRDLTESTPRVLDEQYEFAAPLWTGLRKRVDPATTEGRKKLERARVTGRLARGTH